MGVAGYVKSRLTLLRFRVSERLYKRVRKTIEDARNATIQKIRVLIPKLGDIRKLVFTDLEEVSSVLRLAISRVGIDELGKLGELVPATVEVNFVTKEVEGMKLSCASFEKITSPNYSLFGVPPELDVAINRLYKSLDKLLDLINFESLFYTLLARAKEYQRMINAIDNVLLPRISEAIRTLTLALDEEEREDFIRRSVIQKFAAVG
ncbi:MAG: ATPase [Thermoprotei archaeon ex4572_64]|nr:MAG: ATPase [Thermoprotei archaeon ex4572_64]